MSGLYFNRNGQETNQLIACVAELEIRRSRRELVDEPVDHVAEPSIFISLQVGLQVVFREAFVDLYKPLFELLSSGV